MRTIIHWDNDVPNVPGLPVGQPMLWLRSPGGTWVQDKETFLGQTPNERIAQSEPDFPASAAGWSARNTGTTPPVNPPPSPPNANGWNVEIMGWTTDPPALEGRFINNLVESYDPGKLDLVVDHYDAVANLIFYKNNANAPANARILHSGRMYTMAKFAQTGHPPRKPVAAMYFEVNEGFPEDQQVAQRLNYYTFIQVVNYI